MARRVRESLEWVDYLDAAAPNTGWAVLLQGNESSHAARPRRIGDNIRKGEFRNSTDPGTVGRHVFIAELSYTSPRNMGASRICALGEACAANSSAGPHRS